VPLLSAYDAAALGFGRAGGVLGHAITVPHVDYADRAGEMDQFLLGEFGARLPIDLVADSAAEL